MTEAGALLKPKLTRPAIKVAPPVGANQPRQTTMMVDGARPLELQPRATITTTTEAGILLLVETTTRTTIGARTEEAVEVKKEAEEVSEETVRKARGVAVGEAEVEMEKGVVAGKDATTTTLMTTILGETLTTMLRAAGVTQTLELALLVVGARRVAHNKSPVVGENQPTILMMLAAGTVLQNQESTMRHQNKMKTLEAPSRVGAEKMKLMNKLGAGVNLKTKRSQQVGENLLQNHLKANSRKEATKQKVRNHKKEDGARSLQAPLTMMVDGPKLHKAIQLAATITQAGIRVHSAIATTTTTMTLLGEAKTIETMMATMDGDLPLRAEEDSVAIGAASEVTATTTEAVATTIEVEEEASEVVSIEIAVVSEAIEGPSAAIEAISGVAEEASEEADSATEMTIAPVMTIRGKTIRETRMKAVGGALRTMISPRHFPLAVGDRSVKTTLKKSNLVGPSQLRRLMLVLRAAGVLLRIIKATTNQRRPKDGDLR